MTNAVIFDVDGTLVDSNQLHALCWQETFRHFGKEVPLPALHRQIGKGGDHYMPVFWTEEELCHLGKQMAEFRKDLYQRKYLRQGKPFPGAKEIVVRVRKEGRPVALASSSKAEEIQFYIELLDIEDLLDTHTSADDAERSKPSPDIFAAALERLAQQGAEGAIVIGDSPFDVQAAGKLGLQTIGVLCGGFSEHDLRASGAVAIYQGPADLLAKYDSSPLAR